MTMLPSTAYSEAPAPATNGLRHRCRNPRCGLKLKRLTDNPRNAFCCSGCVTSYFRNRCVVCERTYKRKTEHQWFCRPKCKSKFRRHPEQFLGKWGAVLVLARSPTKTPIKPAGKSGSEGGRAFRQVAGPRLSSTAFRLATIPLNPELAARIARANAGFGDWLRKSKRAAIRRAQIKRHHPPMNVLGGYRFPNAPAIDLGPVEDLPVVRSRWAPTGTGVTPPIPEFLLRRAPVPALMEETA
jgi:hypothetical protein